MNQIEAIKEAARKAAQAQKNHDQGMVTHMRDWARRAIALQDNPQEAEKEYQEAYRQECLEIRPNHHHNCNSKYMELNPRSLLPSLRANESQTNASHAAAPELLEACKGLLALAYKSTNDDSWIKIAERAIAKAEGRK
mgnify:CR=1 FL=1